MPGVDGAGSDLSQELNLGCSASYSSSLWVCRQGQSPKYLHKHNWWRRKWEELKWAADHRTLLFAAGSILGVVCPPTPLLNKRSNIGSETVRKGEIIPSLSSLEKSHLLWIPWMALLLQALSLIPLLSIIHFLKQLESSFFEKIQLQEEKRWNKEREKINYFQSSLSLSLSMTSVCPNEELKNNNERSVFSEWPILWPLEINRAWIPCPF